MTTWNATLLLVHLTALVGAVMLYKHAPCWMQKLTMALFIAALSVGSLAFSLAFAGYDHMRWPIFLVALAIEHLGVLLLVFRLIYQDHLKWTSSSASSHSS